LLLASVASVVFALWQHRRHHERLIHDEGADF
jgi:hypothetical protein